MKYEIVSCFIHFATKELMYRMKVTFDSGGISYQVMSNEQYNNMMGWYRDKWF
jgi:hypothetical protein